MSHERRKSERHSPDKGLLVHNMLTGEPIGELVNLSLEGAMFVTFEPIKTHTTLKCRAKLPQEILGRNELIFDAVCLWNRKNVKMRRWESGYRLEVTGIDADLVSYLVLSFKLKDLGEANMPEVRTVNLENRRSSVRCDFDNPLAVFEVHSYRQIGEMADLSIGGFRMFTTEPVDREVVLKCRVRLPQKVFQQEYLILKAECMWCREHDDGRFESGFKLENLPRDDAATILHLLIHFAEIQRTRPRLQVVK